MASPLMRPRNPIPQQPMGQPSQPMPAGQGNGNLIERMLFNKMYQGNPQFRQFADSVRGMSPEQAFQQQGLDYSQYQNIGIDQVRRMFGF